MSEDLRRLRVSQGIPAKEMVEVVQRIYPKYDKTIQSKCENGDVYGIMLRPDAMNALHKAFPAKAAEKPKRPKGERHRYTCRISARLPETDYGQLQQRIKADGYSTMQSWLTAVVKKYLEKEAGSE